MRRKTGHEPRVPAGALASRGRPGGGHSRSLGDYVSRGPAASSQPPQPLTTNPSRPPRRSRLGPSLPPSPRSPLLLHEHLPRNQPRARDTRPVELPDHIEQLLQRNVIHPRFDPSIPRRSRPQEQPAGPIQRPCFSRRGPQTSSGRAKPGFCFRGPARCRPDDGYATNARAQTSKCSRMRASHVWIGINGNELVAAHLPCEERQRWDRLPSQTTDCASTLAPGPATRAGKRRRRLFLSIGRLPERCRIREARRQSGDSRVGRHHTRAAHKDGPNRRRRAVPRARKRARVRRRNQPCQPGRRRRRDDLRWRTSEKAHRPLADYGAGFLQAFAQIATISSGTSRPTSVWTVNA